MSLGNEDGISSSNISRRSRVGIPAGVINISGLQIPKEKVM